METPTTGTPHGPHSENQPGEGHLSDSFWAGKSVKRNPVTYTGEKKTGGINLSVGCVIALIKV